MGWLRDMMQRGDAPCRSFGELARRCLSHPSWPAEPRPKPRSLATLFSRLDRDLDLDWLRDRPAVQATLAEVLAAPVADVQVQCQAPARGFGAPAEATLRFDDIPFARSLRLKEEPLPPGIPLLPQRVSAWNHVWWFAPSGSGRSLLGRWLDARGAARWVPARDWPTAQPDTLEPSPVFVELHSPSGSESLRRRPPRDKICVAADFLPETNNWTVVESLPLSTYIAELVTWVRDRLPSDSQLEPDTAITWLAGLPHDRGILTTLGSALGLLGLMDEIGHPQIRGRSLNQLARAAIKFRVAKLAGDHSLVKEQGLEILTGICSQCLTETNQPATLPREEDEWLRLIPPEQARGIDVEWVKVSLQRAGAPVTVRELERAARQLPPGAYRIVRALSGGGLLRNLELDSTLSLGPVWLLNVARAASLRQLLARPAHEWGEALLASGPALLVLEALQERLEQDPDPVIDAVLELEARDSPAYAAAVESLVRLLGLNPLLLRELSPELLRSLLEEQIELSVVIAPSAPLPRLEHPEEMVRAAPVLSRGAWYVAVWALAERLPSRAPPVDAWFDPWRAGTGLDLAPALDHIQSWLEVAPNDAAEELLLRLFQRRGLSNHASHDLERAALCLSAFRTNTLSAALLDPWKPALFERIVRALETQEEVSAFTNRAVECWVTGGCPAPASSWFEAGNKPAESIWSLLERDTLLQVIASGAPIRVPWEFLSAEQWTWVAEFWLLNSAPGEPSAAPSGALVIDQERMLRHIPGETIAALVALGGSAQAWPERTLTDAWRAQPERLLNSLEQRLLQAGRGDAGARLAATRDLLWLLVAEPPAATSDALDLLSAHVREMEQEAGLLAEVVRFLQARVARRGAGWRVAYELLDGIQERRQRLARHDPAQA